MYHYPDLLAQADWLSKIVNFEIIKANAIWRFVLILLIIIITLALGRITQFFVLSYSQRRQEKSGRSTITAGNGVAAPV